MFNYNQVIKFRPLVHLLFQLIYALFGLTPFGYHLVSLVFHLLNACIFYTLLLRFTSDSKLSLFSSLIFVSHFAQEEALLWVSALSSPVVTFFYLCSIWSLWKYLIDKKNLFYFLSILLGCLALLSKEDGTTVFLAVFLLILLKSGESYPLKVKKALILSLPFMILTFLYSLVRYLTVPAGIMSKFLTYNPVVIIKNIAYFGISFLFPVRLFFDLVGFQVHSYLNSIIQLRLNNSWVILVLLIIGMVFLWLILFLWRKKIRGFKLGLVFVLLGILPYLLVNGNGQRFLYFPLLGFSLVLASLLLSLSDRLKKVKLANLLLISILVFNGLTIYERSSWWRKAGTVCREVINQSGQIVSSFPAGSEVYFANLPPRMNGAYTFHTGFEEAISLFHPQVGVKVNDLGQLGTGELRDLKDSSKDIYVYQNKRFEKL